MAAGLGFKEFTTGDVLTAADANGYLASQVVMVFADSAARTTAITSPQEGMISYLKDTNAVEKYDGAAWVAVGGGASPLTTKGDLYTFSTVDARLPVGANGTTLVADSVEATGLKWVTPSSGGMTLLSTTTLSGASVTVSGIDQTYTNLMIIITGMSSSSDYAPKFQYNSVTTGYFGIISNDASTANTRISGGTYLDAAVADIWEGSNPNSLITYYIPNYTATGYHTVTYQCAYLTNLATMRQFTASGGNTNTSAVTSITLTPDTGSFNAGSIKIYGVK